MTPELQAKIASWRAKAANGTLTVEEMTQAMAALREGRMTAAASSPSSKSRAPKVIPTAKSLLDEIGEAE